MELDQNRLRAILEAEHSYYGSRPAVDRRDSRFNPQARDVIASQLRPEMRVLDIGCGNGETLLENSHRFASGLGELRLRPPDASRTAIFPVLVGPPEKTMGITDRLLRAGIYAQGIRPPTVPEGTSRLRFTVMATHQPEHLDQALAALADLVRDGTLEPSY